MGSNRRRIGWRQLLLAGLGLLLGVAAFAVLGQPGSEGVVVVPLRDWPTSSAAYAASTEYVLKVDGVSGSATLKGYEHQIDILSWSFATSRAVSTGTRVGAGKVQCADFQAQQTLDTASLGLARDGLAGTLIPNVTLTGIRGDLLGMPVFLTVHLTDVYETAYHLSSAGATPAESESFNYATITVTFVPQNPDGTLGSPISTGWDCLTGTPIGTVSGGTPAATTTSVTTTTSSPVYGGSLDLVATVASAGGTPAGSVTFSDGSTPVCSGVALSGGTAGCTESGLTVGPHSISAAYSPSSTAFAASSGSLSVAVGPAPLTITADDQTKPYGAPLPPLTVSYSGFVNGDGPGSLTTAPTVDTSATASSHVSGNPYALTPSGAVDPNYSITYVPGTLTVTPVPLTITPQDATKIYGAPLPPLTATYSGLVNGDTPATFASAPNSPPVLSTTATAASHVAGSPYPVTASGAVDSDYVIGYGPAASLTVTPAPLTITADSLSKMYGAPLPPLTATYTGLVNGDTPATFASAPNTPPVLSTTATQASHVIGNPYPITVSGAKDTDYSISFVNGTLTVTPAPLTITADDKQKVLGAPVPPLTVTYTGFVNGDTPASLTTLPVVSTTATATSPPSGDPYPITVSGAVDPDYSFTYGNGMLWVFYRFVGFLSPEQFSDAGRGDQRGLLVSFQLCDVNDRLFTAGSATLSVDGGAPTPAGDFNSGDAFRFTGPGGGNGGRGAQGSPPAVPCGEGEGRGSYQYRADVRALAPGLHLFTAHVDDGTQEDVWVMVRGRAQDERQAGRESGGDLVAYGSLGVSPDPAPRLGQPLTVTGRGFAPGAQVRVDFGTYDAGTFLAGSDGSFSAVVTPPIFEVAGSYDVKAVGEGAGAGELVLRATLSYGPGPDASPEGHRNLP